MTLSWGIVILQRDCRLLILFVRLSITKWIHLNWGDIGIRKFFQNVFDALSSTGVFILEAQDFDTYEKKLKHEVSFPLLSFYMMYLIVVCRNIRRM